jgi:hypothetical protein
VIHVDDLQCGGLTIWTLDVSDGVAEVDPSLEYLIPDTGKIISVPTGLSLADIAEWTVINPTDASAASLGFQTVGYLASVSSDQKSIDTFRAAAALASPGSPIHVPYEPAINGLSRFRVITVFAALIAGGGAVLSLLAMALSLAPIAADRRTQQFAWKVVGSPDRFLVGSQFLYFWTPGFATILAGGAFGLLAAFRGRSVGIFPGDATIAGFAALIPGAIVLLAAVCFAATLTTVSRPQHL